MIADSMPSTTRPETRLDQGSPPKTSNDNKALAISFKIRSIQADAPKLGTTQEMHLIGAFRLHRTIMGKFM
jgi:hypothetical protein